MTTYVAKKVSQHVLKESANNNWGKSPYFINAPVLDRHGRETSKTKKVKRPLPEGISEEDGKILTKVKRRAYRLDNCLSICGLRIGWSVIYGLIPVIGDFFDILLAIMVYFTCMKIKPRPGEETAYKAMKSMMILNITIDGAIGFVPILGDFADAFFKANTRNAMLLTTFLERRGQANLGQLVENKQGSVGRQPRRNGTLDPVAEQHSSDRAPQYESGQRPMRYVSANEIARPQPAVSKQGNPKLSSWLGGFRRDGRRGEPDVERGEKALPPQPPRR